MNFETATLPTRSAGWAVLSALVLTLVACASTPAPTAQMAVANAALAQAASAGGAELAPVDMAAAREKMGRANAAMAAKDHEQALILSQQVQVDAQVAASKAEAERARRALVAVQEASRALREEMARQPR